MSPSLGSYHCIYPGGRALQVEKMGFLAKKRLSLLFFASQGQAIGPTGLPIDQNIPSHEDFHFHLTLVSYHCTDCGGQPPYVIFKNFKKMFPASLWPKYWT